MSLLIVLLVSIIPAFVAAKVSKAYSDRKPSEHAICIVQALGSGVMLATVAMELLPHFAQQGEWGGWIAFAIGVTVMIGIKLAMPLVQKRETQTAFLTAYFIEFSMNGILIGLSSVIGLKTLVLIGLSMCFCATTCALSVVSRLIKHKYSKPQTTRWLRLILCCLPAGAVLAHIWAVAYVSALPVLVAFGAGALLYLAVIELLLEAFENGQKLSITSTFFAGFWIILFFQVLL